MKSTIITIILLISTINIHGATSTDSLYQAAMALPESLPVKQHIKAIKQVLKHNKNYAPAHNRLAWLYLKQNKTTTRQSARFAIERAIAIEPDNVNYQITKGAVLWSQHFYSDAVEHYEDLLKRHPDCADAAYWLGYYYLNEFMDYKDRRDLSSTGIMPQHGVATFTMQSASRDRDLSRLEGQARMTDVVYTTFISEAQKNLETAIHRRRRSRRSKIRQHRRISHSL